LRIEDWELRIEKSGRITPPRRLVSIAAIAILGARMIASISAQSPVTTVAAVDLDRYVGDWFEAARFPNRFQDECIGNVRASYTRRADGRIDVVNRCRSETGETTEARGIARVVDPVGSARLKVRFAPAFLSFLPFVWGDYWILGLADDYSWAVVGSPDRQYLWVLSRARELSPEVFAEAASVATRNGFQIDRLVRTDNAAEAR
jgi:apolipoprotein D and lipocalin family protein